MLFLKFHTLTDYRPLNQDKFEAEQIIKLFVLKKSLNIYMYYAFDFFFNESKATQLSMIIQEQV